MISNEARPYIEASVPVLREHGLAITRTFYKNLFEAHPELKNIFNMGNQANGAQQQSLAAAVFAYAANIDNVAALEPVVKRIVHKHVSVGIKPEHYPIVGRHLLGAIQQTLGEAATPNLLNAWAEAYGQLAKLLIDTEKALYEEAGIEAGQLRDMRVISVRQESDDVRSFTLEPADGQPAPAFKPGQYVSVGVDLPDGLRQLRQYSLSDAPSTRQLRISVKREKQHVARPAGQVSNWLHDHVEVGSLLKVSMPFGEFTPDTESNEPIVLLSAGVGITPMISALNRIAQINPSRHLIFAHAARDENHHAHQADLAAAKAAMPNLQVFTFYEHPLSPMRTGGTIHEGRMQIASLPGWPRTETDVYLCGPLEFMKAQWTQLITAGVPVSRLHREVFGPEMLDYLN